RLRRLLRALHGARSRPFEPYKHLDRSLQAPPTSPTSTTNEPYKHLDRSLQPPRSTLTSPPIEPHPSSGSAMHPAIALAATTSGLARYTFPGPLRPGQFRFCEL